MKENTLREIFDTKTSLNRFKQYVPLFGMAAFLLPVIYSWYRHRNMTFFGLLIAAIEGFCFGFALFLIQWMRYKNVFFEITNDYISKKNGVKTIRTISTKNVEYYFYSDRESFPKLKVRNEKDFNFEMIAGADNRIIAALEQLGINKKV